MTNRKVCKNTRTTRTTKLINPDAAAEQETYDWMLAQRILMMIGQLEDWQIVTLETEILPGTQWLRQKVTEREIGHALCSEDSDLNEAFAAFWNYFRFSPEPMTFAEVRVQYERKREVHAAYCRESMTIKHVSPSSKGIPNE